MIDIVIPLEPVAWAAHRGYGKKSFNPRYKEREAYQWYIRSQYKDKPLEGAVIVEYTYCFKIPKSFSKKKVKSILDRETMHTKKPDIDNLNKFLSDVLKGIVIKDDNQIYGLDSRKRYSDKDEVKITIWENVYAPHQKRTISDQTSR